MTTAQNNNPATLEQFQAEVTRHSLEVCGETPDQLGKCAWDEEEIGGMPVYLHRCVGEGCTEEIRYFGGRGLWAWQSLEKGHLTQGFGATLEDAI